MPFTLPDIEAVVLGSALLQTDVAEVLVDRLTPEHFTLDTSQIIFKAIGCGSLRGTQCKISTHRQTESDRCSHVAEPLGMNSSPRRPRVFKPFWQEKRPQARMISR